jgi:hypothetical protein
MTEYYWRDLGYAAEILELFSVHKSGKDRSYSVLAINAPYV